MLFISHTATDRPFAAAIERAIHGLLASESLLAIKYSSSSEAGPQGGDEWRTWINDQIVAARTVIVIVSPSAIGKPWLMWEAGACHGASLMSESLGSGAPSVGTRSRLLASVSFGLTGPECPDPLKSGQIVPGTDGERMEKLLEAVIDHELPDLPRSESTKIGRRAGSVMDEYLDSVRSVLQRMPSLVTEANVQDWLERLDDWIRSQRGSELDGFERWMALAFGREGEAAGLPIDVRLHRRLGEQYLALRSSDPRDREHNILASVKHLELARLAAPRDIYVLRPLGRAYMEAHLLKHAALAATLAGKLESVLEAIEEIDPDAFTKVPDAAALRAKYERLITKDIEQAIRFYQAALDASPDSYYLADVLGQTQLEAGNRDGAVKSFERALEIINRLKETNVWTCATEATSYLVLGNPAEARTRLQRLRELQPRPKAGEIESVVRGLREVAGRLGMSDVEIGELEAIVRDVAA